MGASQHVRRRLLLAALMCAVGAWLWTQHWPIVPYEEGKWQWTPLLNGVDIALRKELKPRPLRMHAVRIDLTKPGLRVRPSSGLTADASTGTAAPLPGEVSSSTTAEWLVASGCQLAMNASPFAPLAEEPGTPMVIQGVFVVDGRRLSEAERSRDLLILWNDPRNSQAHGRWADIAPWDSDWGGADHVISGFEALLLDGVMPEHLRGNPELHPRSAVGLSADGKTMFWLVVDGRQEGDSEGTTLVELSEWMRDLGAAKALNLDGGGSSTLALQRAIAGPRILNRTIHEGVPGRLRQNGNHLGVWTSPLP